MNLVNNPETLTNMGANNMILWTKEKTPVSFREAGEYFGNQMHFMTSNHTSEYE
jgi:hypothetical protein